MNALPSYPDAQIIAHPNMTAAQAVEVAHQNGRRLIQTRAGNFYLSTEFSAAQEPAAAGSGLHPVSPPVAAAGPDDEPRAA